MQRERDDWDRERERMLSSARRDRHSDRTVRARGSSAAGGDAARGGAADDGNSDRPFTGSVIIV